MQYPAMLQTAISTVFDIILWEYGDQVERKIRGVLSFLYMEVIAPAFAPALIMRCISI